MAAEKTDIWAAWIRHRRTGGDPELEAKTMEGLSQVRDTVLDHAALAPGETVLDVGCGNGLIGFGALERGAGHVIFSDISKDLLDDARAAATELLLLDRCEFVQARAENLSVVPGGSVDVVTTRSVLIFVKDKLRALREFHRVLREGGCVSMFEPIGAYFGTGARTWPWDTTAVADLMAKVNAVFECYQPRDDPMLDFDDRDLVAMVREAGFDEVHMQLDVHVMPTPARSWDAMLNTAWNPKVPTGAEALDEALTPDERERFTAHLRPLVETGEGVGRTAVAWVWAVKR
jgi:arsenite methyltransferase